MNSSPRSPLRPSERLLVATYNVRTLRADKQHQLIDGCNKFGIDVVVIQEHRQQLNVELDIQLLEEGLLARISASDRSHGGIGLFASRRVRDSITISKVNERIIEATISGNPSLTILGVYAPTESADVEVKHSFYGALERSINSVPPHNILIVAGDINARIGRNSRSDLDRNIGPFLMHDVTNDNGQKLVQLARDHDLFVAQTAFPHRAGHLWTWHSPHDTTAQLDHILIN